MSRKNRRISKDQMEFNFDAPCPVHPGLCDRVVLVEPDNGGWKYLRRNTILQGYFVGTWRIGMHEIQPTPVSMGNGITKFMAADGSGEAVYVMPAPAYRKLSPLLLRFPTQLASKRGSMTKNFLSRERINFFESLVPDESGSEELAPKAKKQTVVGQWSMNVDRPMPAKPLISMAFYQKPVLAQHF